MAVSFNCRCKPKRKSNWRVVQYMCNHSAFNGYHCTPSDYSTVACIACLAIGRTKADYVHGLPQWTPEEEREHQKRRKELLEDFPAARARYGIARALYLRESLTQRQ